MDVAWTTVALSILGRWDRYTRNVVGEEFSEIVTKNPGGFGTSIENSVFLSTPISNSAFFVISEYLQEKNIVLVVAISREPLKTVFAVSNLISAEKNRPKSFI